MSGAWPDRHNGSPSPWLPADLRSELASGEPASRPKGGGEGAVRKSACFPVVPVPEGGGREGLGAIARPGAGGSGQEDLGFIAWPEGGGRPGVGAIAWPDAGDSGPEDLGVIAGPEGGGRQG